MVLGKQINGFFNSRIFYLFMSIIHFKIVNAFFPKHLKHYLLRTDCPFWRKYSLI